MATARGVPLLLAVRVTFAIIVLPFTTPKPGHHAARAVTSVWETGSSTQRLVAPGKTVPSVQI